VFVSVRIYAYMIKGMIIMQNSLSLMMLEIVGDGLVCDQMT